MPYDSAKKQLEAVRLWRRNNPEKMREYKRKHREKNKEKIANYQREYREKNKDRLSESASQWRAKNWDHVIGKERVRRQSNPEKYRTMSLARKREKPGAYHLYSVRKTAKVKGLAFDLDVEWFDSRLSAGVCEMSGLPFDCSKKRGSNSPSVDRINPKGPYTKDNCRMVLWWINRALSNLGEDYYLDVFRAIFIKRGEMLEYEDRAAA